MITRDGYGSTISCRFAGVLCVLMMIVSSDTLRAQVPTSRPTTTPAESRPAAEVRPDFESMDRYYLHTCAMCGGLLGAKGEAITISHERRMLRVCGNACRKSFENDPVAGVAKADAIMIADQLPHYPLRTSLIDERPLGAQPIDFVWGNRLFRAVDAADREKILADPASAIRKLDRAVIAAQSPSYGMPRKCPVQGDILPTDSVIDIVVANRMVRVCCGKCARTVRERPSQYLDMVDYANRQVTDQAKGERATSP